MKALKAGSLILALLLFTLVVLKLTDDKVITSNPLAALGMAASMVTTLVLVTYLCLELKVKWFKYKDDDGDEVSVNTPSEPSSNSVGGVPVQTPKGLERE